MLILLGYPVDQKNYRRTIMDDRDCHITTYPNMYTYLDMPSNDFILTFY